MKQTAQIAVVRAQLQCGVHEKVMAVRRVHVERDRPPLAVDITGPVVVRDDDFAVPGVAASGDESAAMIRSGDG